MTAPIGLSGVGNMSETFCVEGLMTIVQITLAVRFMSTEDGQVDE